MAGRPCRGAHERGVRNRNEGRRSLSCCRSSAVDVTVYVRRQQFERQRIPSPDPNPAGTLRWVYFVCIVVIALVCTLHRRKPDWRSLRRALTAPVFLLFLRGTDAISCRPAIAPLLGRPDVSTTRSCRSQDQARPDARHDARKPTLALNERQRSQVLTINRQHIKRQKVRPVLRQNSSPLIFASMPATMSPCWSCSS